MYIPNEQQSCKVFGLSHKGLVVYIVLLLWMLCHMYVYLMHSVPEFETTQYPVTNGEFLEFVESGGYQNRHLWTDEGPYIIDCGTTL